MALLSALIAWSLRNKAVVLVGTLLLIALGTRAAFVLPVDAVPDVTNIQVQIITSSPALSPVEVEQYVTVPVERAMAGIPRVTEVRSLSKYGLSVVTVVFEDETDIYFARQLVLERMREAEDGVPSQYGKPEMGPISSGLGEIFQFVVRGEGHTLMELEETLDWYIAPRLRTVPGIVEVNSFGGEDKQYQVVIDPSRLQAMGLSVEEIARALEHSNANAGGGYIEHNREQFVIGSLGLVKSIDDLRTIVVGATPQNVPITLDTVAEVQLGPRLRRGAASMDGQGEVVVGVALMLMGENSRTVTSALKEKIREIEPTLPKGMRIEPFYDRSLLVDRTIGTVAKNLLEGALLVVVILLLLLGNVRAGLIVATTIPLAMLFAIAVMRWRGVTGNLMSLGAIDFGLIVDGAVIIVENSVRRLGERRHEAKRVLNSTERSDVVRDASIEVLGASLFGQAIIMIVYVPILTLRGVEGKLFQPMAFTVVAALAGAFVLSLTLVPVLTALLIAPAAEERETWLLRQTRRLYGPMLSATLRWRRMTVGTGLLFIALGGLLLTRVGAEFVPVLDEGDLLIEARRLPGIALTQTVATDQRIQQAVRTVPEVAHVVSKTGAPELATDPMGVEQTDVYIVLKPREQWRAGLTKADLGEEVMRAFEEQLPDVAGTLSQPIQMRTNELVAGVRSDVAAILYGPDLATLDALGKAYAAALSKVPGAVDLRVEQTSGLRYLRVVPDRARLARYGLTVADVNQLTETMAVGHSVGTILEGERQFSLVVKMAHHFDGDLESLRALPLKSTTGQMVPLGDVADLAFEDGPAEVNREKGSRRITVEFNVRGRDLLSTVRDAQEIVRPLARPGYLLEWGGQFEHFVGARNRLAVVVPVALALILFLLWMAFQSLSPALLIFLNIPFAIVGGVAALWLRGIPFSISAGVGFIALFGVAVLNGLVLVSFTRRLEQDGLHPHEAIRRAAELRLRPVLMTALVAALGFLPMALSTSPGSEVQRPLATVVIGGLVTATLLTLLVFPAVYQLVRRQRPQAAP
jgi:cobalt-zinc-cadmium resistance protein CzcA